MHFPAYLAFTDPVTLYRLLKTNGGFDARFALRVLILFLVSWVMLPFNWLEKYLYGRAVAQHPLSDSPLIILGHDRSGTTHLLNLLSLDPQFSYTRPSQMVLPGCCILFDKPMDFLLSLLDYKRPFDNMDVGPGSPQDDEVPLVKLTPHAEYHKYSFPRNYRFWLDTYVFNFTEQSPAYAEWRDTYLGTLRKAAYLMQKNRPLLKSPATLGNLNVVTRLFPNARYIHIKRNPYKVLPSQVNLHQVMVDKYALESVSRQEIHDFAIFQYRGYMNGFLRDRALIPPENLVEIRYEDFVQDRYGHLEAIYRQLGLGDFSAVRPAVEAHLASVAGYEKHNFPDDAAFRARIHDELGFAFAALGYQRETGEPC